MDMKIENATCMLKCQRNFPLCSRAKVQARVSLALIMKLQTPLMHIFQVSLWFNVFQTENAASSA